MAEADPFLFNQNLKKTQMKKITTCKYQTDIVMKLKPAVLLISSVNV